MVYPRVGLASRIIPPVRFMVVAGSLGEGLSFYGPFDYVAAAREWATLNMDDSCPREFIPLHYIRSE